MCLNPILTPDGVETACRKCWQCLKDRQNDLVGRCIAESHSATSTWAVTLTYSGGANNIDAQHLNYADFQKFMKRLRDKGTRNGFTVRYLVAGEYGSKRGRAHWHAILFFYGNGPRIAHEPETRDPFDIIEEQRFDWWPWTDHKEGRGVAYFQQPQYEDFAYAVKQIVQYTTKETATFKTTNKGLVQYTKQPPLGTPYFEELAGKYARQGIAPQNAQYSFPGLEGRFTDAKGKTKRRKYRLKGAMLERFCEHFLTMWGEHQTGEPPESELLERYEDKQAARNRDDDLQTLPQSMQRNMREVMTARDKYLPRYHVAGFWLFEKPDTKQAKWKPGKEMDQWLEENAEEAETRLELAGVSRQVIEQFRKDVQHHQNSR